VENRKNYKEISSELLAEIKRCKLCTTITGYRKFPSTSHGNLHSKYILVSEAPGKESLLRNQYWVGVGGQILRSTAKATNTVLEDLFYLTDIVKCWPNEHDFNRTPYQSEIFNCYHFLLKEIEELKPELIVTFGKIASSYLLKREVKIKKEHGKIFNFSSDTKILTLLHPTGIDRQMSRDVYKNQLTVLFDKLKSGQTNKLSDIFR